MQKIIFKKRKGVSKGKTFFTWTAKSTNKNIVNHKYNSKQTRDLTLKSFISKIKKGEYVIED